MGDRMSVTSHVAPNGVITIRVEGRFDYSVHRDFREAYKEHPAGATYVIDLSRTNYMDSAALGMLLVLKDHAAQGALSILGANGSVKKVLTIANFHKLIPLHG
jgi:anti-anti-sigma factor